MTIPRLADEVGLSHAEARRIAVREFPALRKFHKSQPLLGYQITRLRKQFLAARPAPVAPTLLAEIPRPEPTTLPPNPRQPAQEEKTMPTPRVDSMTIREIADLCEVDPATVGRWASTASCKMPEISCKVQKARETSKAALFTLSEVLAIIRAGGRGLLADLLEENAKAKPTAPKAKLPAGVQLHELRMIYGPGEAAKRLDLILGYSKPAAALPHDEPCASDAEAALYFGQLYARLGARGIRQISAMAGTIAEREAAGRAADSMQGRLGL